MLRVLVAGVLLLSAASARSETPADVVVARQHFTAGAAAFQKGDFEEAVREFEAAYALSKRADLLYNIGRCREALFEHEKAVVALRAYLAAKPNASDRSFVEGRIAALERRIAERRRKAEQGRTAAPSPASAPTAAATPVEAVSARPPARRVRLRWTWVTGSLMLASAAGATAASVLARSRFNDLRTSCGASETGCTAGQIDDVHRRALAANVLWATTGAAALATGIALWLELRAPRTERAVSATPVCGPSMAGLSVSGRF